MGEVVPFRKKKEKPKPPPESPEFNLALILGMDRIPMCDTDTDGTGWPPADMLGDDPS